MEKAIAELKALITSMYENWNRIPMMYRPMAIGHVMPVIDELEKIVKEMEEAQHGH